MDIALLLGLVLLNGVFAMSEISVVTARRLRLQKLAEEGDHGAAAALKLNEDPTRFLSTVQIGITSIGILNGIVGEAALAGPLALWLQTLSVDAELSRIGATVLVVVVITYISIVLGELVPKRIGQLSPESIARLVARPMSVLARITHPFVLLLSGSTAFILKVLGVRTNAGSNVTEDEIHAMLAEGSDAGVIEQNEHTMVRNLFRLDDRQLSSLMTPRGEVVYLDVEAPMAETLRLISEVQHTRFPVCRGDFSDVLGIVSARRILPQLLKGEPVNIADNLAPAVFVPETLTGMELLENFRQSNANLALVVDEYGEVQGLVTAQDLLEAIAGEFKPHNLDDAWATQRADGSWLLDGPIPVPELKDHLALKSVPDPDRGRYHTLAGMLMWELGRVPKTGDSLQWENWRLEVVDMDGNRIDKVLATRESLGGSTI